MTDSGINEIYTLAQAAVENGHRVIRVHSFPFPMTDANMETVQNSPHYAFWQNLQDGWNWFETRKTPPDVRVRNKVYTFHMLPTPNP